MRRGGASYGEIARALTEDGIPKPAGGHGWQRSHVWRMLGTAAARDLRDKLD
ncbi:recombinase family protein [Nocardia asteroides]|uniref:recombinase family protein n=1 Tax=Nocardia asteroides TaxID=1824 RepID=UPI0033DE2426